MSDKIEEARKAILLALNSLNIKTIIFVDDAFTQQISKTEFIGLVKSAIFSGISLSNMPILDSIDVEQHEQILEHNIEMVWDGIEDPADRLKIINQLNKLLENEYTDRDAIASSILLEILPREIKYLPLSPKEWLNNYKTILDGASSNCRFLCLFDQDMSFDESGSKRPGIELLKNIVTEYGEGNIICALLTHTVPRNQEIASWQDLASKNDLQLHEFLIISKDSLEEPNEFARGIKITLMNQTCERLKRMALGISNDANLRAYEELRGINVYDFYYIVLKSSEDEGIWEAETLFRLFGIFYQHEAQKIALSDEKRQVINEAIKILRNIRKVKVSYQEEIQNLTWTIRRKELYYDESMNEFNYSLQLGDIFETESGEKYILLSQPCDLAFRSDGRRNLSIGVFARIVQEVPENSSVSYEELPYFNQSNGSKAYVRLKRVEYIDLDVLDLSSYNKDGSCFYDPNLSLELFHKASVNRFRRIKRSMEQKISEFNDLKAAVENSNINADKKIQIINALSPTASFTKLPINVIIDQDKIKFGIKRIGRYKRPYSDMLLDKYVKFIGRKALEHDIAKLDEVC